jgi:hypothetical protein
MYFRFKDGENLMDINGKGITQSDLESLPEVDDVVLWQPDDEAPSYVTDTEGAKWAIGFYGGQLCKRKK